MFEKTDAQGWTDRGIDAFRNNRFADAAEYFGKAVAIDPQSVTARLSLGAACVVQYIPGTQSEENAVWAMRAEENLLEAIQLDPRNKLGMIYLAALYFSEANQPQGKASRFEDARKLFERTLEIYPDYAFASYACGVIDWWKARKSPRVAIDALLRRSAQNLLRALQIDPEHSNAMAYLSLVRRGQAAAAASDDDRLRLTREADEWNRKVDHIRQARAQPITRGLRKPFPPKSSSRSQAISFEPIVQTPGKSGNPELPQFPPEQLAEVIIPPPPPPPPPPVSR